MISDNFLCNICCITFDENIYLPLFLPCCQQSICKFCVNNLAGNQFHVRCPYCKSTVPTSELKSNRALIPILDAINLPHCRIHKKPHDIICESCEEKICINCLTPNHKNHEIESIQKFFEAYSRNKSDWREYINKANDKCLELQIIIDEKKKRIRDSIDKKFGDLCERIKWAHRRSLQLFEANFEKLELHKFYSLSSTDNETIWVEDIMKEIHEQLQQEDLNKYESAINLRRFEKSGKKDQFKEWINTEFDLKCEERISELNLKFNDIDIEGYCTINFQNGLDELEMFGFEKKEEPEIKEDKIEASFSVREINLFEESRERTDIVYVNNSHDQLDLL